MGFLLAQEGQTTDLVFNGVKFTVKVLPYGKRLDWLQDSDATENWESMKNHFCKIIIAVDGYDNPKDFLDKIVFAKDIGELIGCLGKVDGLDEDSGKNLEDSLESSNSTNTEDVTKPAETASGSVSITDLPKFSNQQD